MVRIDLSKRSLKKFGITMGIAFLVITVLIIIRHRHSMFPSLVISAVFFAAAFLTPVLLKPVYIIWMKLALVLSWVNTRLILLAVFYLILTPIGLCLKVFHKDLLDVRIDEHKDSYWKAREKKQFIPQDFERLF